MSARRTVVVIGAASGAGAPDPGTAAGPEALRRLHALHDTASQRIEWDAILHAPPHAREMPLQAVVALGARLAGHVGRVLRAGRFPLVVGGDHSCAIGTWTGVQRALAERGPLGLMWIDAHMDSHTFATSPSGRLHGMPLAALLGEGDAALAGTAPTLRPEHVCLVGVRSFEAGEAALLHRLGVRVFDMAAVRRHGLAVAFDAALAIVRRGTAGFGVSIDLDALDPVDAPGTGSPVPGGLGRVELAAALARLRDDPAFVAMEIVEYDPQRDRDHRTADAVRALVDAIAPHA